MTRREFDNIVDEVKGKLMVPTDEKKSNKAVWIAAGVAVVVALVGVVLWICKKNEDDIEEYYEYFDEEVDEALEDLYDDEEATEDKEEVSPITKEDVEYVPINNNDTVEEDGGQEDTAEEATEE